MRDRFWFDILAWTVLLLIVFVATFFVAVFSPRGWYAAALMGTFGALALARLHPKG